MKGTDEAGESKGLVAGFWIATVLLALQMSFTAYAQLRLPVVAAEFAHLGFPGYFRVELSWAKLLGVVVLLVPMAPAWMKEWAYAGFAMTLGSALIAHMAVGDGPKAWGWAAGTGVLWGLSYFFWRRLLRRRRVADQAVRDAAVPGLAELRGGWDADRLGLDLDL